MLSGCFREKSEIPAAEEKVVLKKVSFNRLAGWNTDDFGEVIPVFAKNCQKVLKNKNTYLIKDADGAINGKPTYARICIRHKK